MGWKMDIENILKIKGMKERKEAFRKLQKPENFPIVEPLKYGVIREYVIKNDVGYSPYHGFYNRWGVYNRSGEPLEYFETVEACKNFVKSITKALAYIEKALGKEDVPSRFT